MDNIRPRLEAIKREKTRLQMLEAKIIAEMKKNKVHLKDMLSYIRERKMALYFEEARLLVQYKRQQYA